MGRYTIEEHEGVFNVFFVDEEEDIKDLVVVAYYEVHAKIFTETLNSFHKKISHRAEEVVEE